MAKESKDLRSIFLDYLSGSTKAYPQKFPDNTITTSRYTLLTFVPKNLFEQFRRMVNFFFLCLIIIQVSIDIPVNPIAYSAAFIFVIGVTGVKQGYEDWCRHQSDNKVNFADAYVLTQSGAMMKTKSKDLQVGQIVRLEQDCDVLCDMLLIACHTRNKEAQSFCQITTVNLDGESNLKMRSCPSGARFLLDDGSIDIQRLSGVSLHYESPSTNLYKLNGEMVVTQENENVIKIPISMDNILLRGSRVRNSASVYGIVLYTGKDTRLSMNSNKVKSSKFSTIERTMNKIVVFMFFLLLILSSASVGISFLYKENTFDGIWYLPHNEGTNAKHGVTIFFSYLVLLCYLIPVSLSVSFELQKLACSKFFPWDEDMVCPSTGTRPLCNTSDLNEELGQIQYLFTDKTGTLTDNDLILRCCSVNGVKYMYDEDRGLLSTEKSETSQMGQNEILSKPDILRFLEAIAVCHTVKVLPIDASNEETTPRYQCESLDEEVLVKASHRLGVKFLGETDNQMNLEIGESRRLFSRVATLEFDSDRKCMSVIVRKEDGETVLYCKGAESSVLPNCEDSEKVTQINRDVVESAKLGLRTLVFAYRILEPNEANSLMEQIEKFRDDEKSLRNLYRNMETSLIPLGCTGVEDKLQEGVPETLESLQKAGIRILMLTGDKLETAVSVAVSCGLLDNSDDSKKLTIISEAKNAEQVGDKLKEIKDTMEKGIHLSVVIDGSSFAIGIENFKDLLAFVMVYAVSVIFCRMAPLQKSQAVNLMKNYQGKEIKTCAVGDGGNDCAMLKEAHLGIGIIGKEGLQAARESDFAVGRFRFLKKAILVHGYWYYYRLANLIIYFFYRGVVFIFLIFMYGFDSGFTATTIFDSTFVMMFTIAFTSAPVVVQGITEQPFSKEELMENPFHYRNLMGNRLMSFRKCFRWIVIGIWHVLLGYYVPRFVWLQGLSGVHDYGAFSLYISSIVVLIADTKILVETRYFTWPALILQLLSYFVMFTFYSLICQVGSNPSGLIRFSYYPLLQQGEFWISIVLIAILSVVPDLVAIGINTERN